MRLSKAPVSVLNALLQDVCAQLTHSQYLQWTNSPRSDLKRIQIDSSASDKN